MPRERRGRGDKDRKVKSEKRKWGRVRALKCREFASMFGFCFLGAGIGICGPKPITLDSPGPVFRGEDLRRPSRVAPD